MVSESIIRLIKIYAARTGKTESTISTYAAGAGGFYDRLMRGHDLTTRRAARVTQWLSDHWPADLEWPEDIARPAPTPGSSAIRGNAA